MGKFPIARVTDAAGNVWWKQGALEKRFNSGVRGAHVALPFQCEQCWVLNLEGRAVIPGLDDTLLMCIRRANLDAINGRARNTLGAHASEVMRRVRDCAAMNKTPSLDQRGPFLVKDEVGMGLAVEMEYRSLVARGKINKEGYIQYESLRKMRGTSTKLYQSSPRGVASAISIGTGLKKMSMSECPTQSDWYSLFNTGIATRMGSESCADKPLPMTVIVRLLELIESEADGHPRRIAFGMLKVGAAIVMAVCSGLRGPEIFMTCLAGLRKYLYRGRSGVVPRNPYKKGVDLTKAPHVYIVMLGLFKGEHNVREYMIAIASDTLSGLNPRKWIERLIKIRELEGFTHGPAFGNPDGSLASQVEYTGVLIYFLEKIQAEKDSEIPPEEDLRANYSMDRTWRKSAMERARIARFGKGGLRRGE